MSEIIVYLLASIILIIALILELVKILLCLFPLLWSLLIISSEPNPYMKKEYNNEKDRPILLGVFILLWLYVSARSIYFYFLNWYSYALSPDKLDWNTLMNYGFSKSWDYAFISLLIFTISLFIFYKIIGKNPNYNKQ